MVNTKDLNNLRAEVANKVEKLKTQGLTTDDKKILPRRFKSLWMQPRKSDKSIYRHDVACEAISTTECGNKETYETTITPLLDLKSYDDFKFSLRSDDKSFLEDMAKRWGFGESSNYVALMQALFSNDQSTPAERTITYAYAYSEMPRENLPFFIQTVANAVETSTLYLNETQRGDKETEAATVLIPAGDEDCSVTIVVNRASIIGALRQCGFKKIWEKSL